MEIVVVVVGIVCIVIGVLVGNLLSKKIINNNVQTASIKAQNLIDKAKIEAETIKKEAHSQYDVEAKKAREDVEKEYRDKLNEIKNQESRLISREKNLDKRNDSLDSREKHIDDLAIEIKNKEKFISQSVDKINKELEHVSGLSKEEAKSLLMERLKKDLNNKAAAAIKESEYYVKSQSDKLSREILSTAIQRLASNYTSEITVTTIPIPSDDLKGRIIGREGRNIRSFESITGADLLIDDSPETITISCHDPVRREIAAQTMLKLIADGRIQPARIEEIFEKTTSELETSIQQAGQEAAYETGVHNLSPDVMYKLGSLKYRRSFGQNVLNHSLEVAYLSGIMATELGLNPTNAKRAGLLHDIGKSIDHEMEGSHAVIGADFIMKNGESEEIVHAVRAHHEDIEASTILDVLVQSADAISAARPGARKESAENYIKRLEQLENVAKSYNGVKKAYAIKAGREVRVMVSPKNVSDDESVVLAHDIAKQIENEMQYPGQVKVVIIRETRAEDFAK